MLCCRKFSALGVSGVKAQPPLLGVIFDLDGTLILPQSWMFRRMRDVLGIDRSIDILEHIGSLPDTESQKAMKKIEMVEEEAMVQMTAREGLGECLLGLRAHGVRVAICTRNFSRPVEYFLEKIVAGKLGINAEIEPIVDRSFHPPKPRGEPLLHIMRKWGISPDNVMMVGDSRDDMLAGRRAGCATVLIGDENIDVGLVDKRVVGLIELMRLLRAGFIGDEVSYNSSHHLE